MVELSLDEMFEKIKDGLSGLEGTQVADIINASDIFEKIVYYDEDQIFHVEDKEIEQESLYNSIFEVLEQSDGLVTEDLATLACEGHCDYQGDGIWGYVDEPQAVIGY